MAVMTRGTAGVGIAPLGGGGVGVAGVGMLFASALVPGIISGMGGAAMADRTALIVGLGMVPPADLGMVGVGIAAAVGPGAP
jgi:hypothetical protein